MPYKVMRVVDVETHGGRSEGDYSSNEHLEAGLNRLEEEGYKLKSVLHGEHREDQTRLVFHKAERGGYMPRGSGN